MNEFQRIEVLPGDDLAPLIEASAQEGFAFLGRLTREWQAGEKRFNKPLEETAEQHYHALVLRTDSRDAALFYQALGYRSLPPGGTATHRRELAVS